MLEATNYVQNYAGIMYASCQYTTDSLATNPISIICKCHLPVFGYMLTISICQILSAGFGSLSLCLCMGFFLELRFLSWPFQLHFRVTAS